MSHVLIIGPRAERRAVAVESLEHLGWAACVATNLAEAGPVLKSERPRVIVSDALLPDGSAVDLLPQISARDTTLLILLVDDARTARTINELGSSRLRALVAPLDAEAVQHAIDITADGGRRRPQKPKHASQGMGMLLGNSPGMREVYNLIARVAPTDATVLVIGESGTGKELVARALHDRSEVKDKRFIAINCGAIPETLIESELFGHEKGAFTGAEKARRGVFERAHGGTLLLDEITEMPADMQVKLLRVLETRRFRRIGSDDEKETNVRVIAATNRDPGEAVRDGQLREDLLYRLSEFPITLPPLRQRGDDILLLANHFLAQLNTDAGTAKTFSTEAQQRLRTYPWPGNVRQLWNVVRRAHIAEDDPIAVSDIDRFTVLPGSDPPEQQDSGNGDGSVAVDVGTPIAEAERDLIFATLEHYDGNKTRAAEVLGISLKTLYNRLNEYESDPA